MTKQYVEVVIAVVIITHYLWHWACPRLESASRFPVEHSVIFRGTPHASLSSLSISSYSRPLSEKSRAVRTTLNLLNKRKKSGSVSFTSLLTREIVPSMASTPPSPNPNVLHHSSTKNTPT